MLSFSSEAEFLVSANFTKGIIVNKILRFFTAIRKNVDYGSLYRLTNSNGGRKPQLDSIKTTDFALLYLKSAVYRRFVDSPWKVLEEEMSPIEITVQ